MLEQLVWLCLPPAVMGLLLGFIWGRRVALARVRRRLSVYVCSLYTHSVPLAEERLIAQREGGVFDAIDIVESEQRRLWR